jgi:hypothetical protein
MHRRASGSPSDTANEPLEPDHRCGFFAGNDAKAAREKPKRHVSSMEHEKE